MQIITMTYNIIPAKPLHSHDIVSVHFNHFLCMRICDTAWRHISMLTYIYLNMGSDIFYSPAKVLNSKYILIMLVLNTMCFLKCCSWSY